MVLRQPLQNILLLRQGLFIHMIDAKWYDTKYTLFRVKLKAVEVVTLAINLVHVQGKELIVKFPLVFYCTPYFFFICNH